MNIKELLQLESTPVLSVEKNAETAGKLLCEFFGVEITAFHGQAFYTINSDYKGLCSRLILDFMLGHIHVLEKAVIKEVGTVIWAESFEKVVPTKHISLSYRVIEKQCRANALQRLTAMLLAIAEVEK